MASTLRSSVSRLPRIFIWDGVGLLATLLCLCGAVRAGAAAYNPVNEWAGNANTSGRVWTYGYSDTAGNGFTLYKSTEYNDSTTKDDFHFLASDMAVAHNKTSGTITYNDLVTHPVDELMLFPGNDGRRSTVRFTVPATGNYHFEGSFTRRDSKSTCLVTVVRDGNTSSPLFFQNTAGVNTPQTFDILLSFQAGETVDFGSDWGAEHDYSNDGIGFKVNVSSTEGTTPLNTNLLINPGAESTTGAADFNTTATLPGWTVTGGLTPLRYTATGGDGTALTQGASAAISGGANYFAGGQQSAASTATQTIDFTDLASQVNAGSLNAVIDGYFGGNGSQTDNLTMMVKFYNAAGGLLQALPVGGVTATDRNNQTKLLSRTLTNAIPANAVKAKVELTALRDSGSYNDGYADNLSFKIVSIGPTTTGLGATSLTVNGSTNGGEVTSGTKLHFDATQTLHPTGVIVTAQYSTTPADATSWKELPDGLRGKLPASSTADHYVSDTNAYPAGTVYFRAVSSAPGFTSTISPKVGPFILHGATMRLTIEKNTTSDETGNTAQLADKLTYNLRFANIGDQTAKALEVVMIVPYYRNSTTDQTQQQLAKSDITDISPGGKLVKVQDLIGSGTVFLLPSGSSYAPVDSKGQPVMAIRWQKIGDLEPNFSQFVSFSVKVPTKTLVPSTITNNGAVVYSTANPLAPSVGADEITSGTDHKDVAIVSGAKFTVTPDVTTVAPGGYINYEVKLDNLSGVATPFSGAVFTVPQFTRFAGFGLSKKGVPNPNPPKPFQAAVISHATTPSEVVLYFAAIPAHKSAKVTVTVQAQWVEPSEVSSGKIATTYYGGGFITAEAAKMLKDLADGSSTQSYYDLIRQPDFSNSFSTGGGNVFTSFSGSTAGQPDLALLKALIDDSRTSLDDLHTIPSADGDLVNTVESGKQISLVLMATNNGEHAAEDVSIQERLPEGTQLYSLGKHGGPLTNLSKPDDLHDAVAIVTKSDSSDLSKKYTVSLESDQRTLHVAGLHLEPHDTIALTYTVQLQTGSGAPAIGGIVHAGACKVETSSTTHSYFGFPADTPIQVVGHANLATNVQALRRSLEASADVSATATTLNNVFKVKNTYIPLVAGATATSSKVIVPGFQRYTIDYTNNTNAAVSGVTLTVPVPANTVFYRVGSVKDGEVLPLPNNTTAEQPNFLTNGTVRFHFAKLAAGESGAVMVEVIVKSVASSAAGTFITPSDITIGVGSGLAAAKSTVNHSQTDPGSSAQVIDPRTPEIGLSIRQPMVVYPDEVFEVVLIACNRGDVDTAPVIGYAIPEGVQPIDTLGNDGTVDLSSYHSGQHFNFYPSSNNEPFQGSSNSGRLRGHTAGTVILHLKATGAVNTEIISPNNVSLIADNFGKLVTKCPTIQIVPNHTLPLLAKLDGNRMTTVDNLDHAQLPGGGIIIRLEGSGDNLVAAGAGNLIAAGAGNLIAAGAGNLIAAGAGNAIPLSNVSGFASGISASALLADPSALLKAGGNLFNNAQKLISQDGSGLIANDGTGFFPVNKLIAAGAGNLVAAGAGNLVAAGAGNILAAGAGRLVAAGAGNIFTTGGALVAAGAGNIVAAGAGNLVSAGAGNIVVSGAHSSALVAAGAGNFTRSGGAQLIAAGAGN